MSGGRPAPSPDCPFCPRLVEFRSANRAAFPDWHNAPVPSFGDPAARLLIVGLAPGLRGANRTGRPFTGDFAGDLLYPTLLEFGFARGSYGRHPGDGLELVDCRIANAVRCVPPENRPIGSEVANCRQFLTGELLAAPTPEVVLTLGSIAHASTLRALGLKENGFPFRHGAVYRPDGHPIVAPSYHCSRQNVNTGRLTPAMFAEVVGQVRRLLQGS